MEERHLLRCGRELIAAVVGGLIGRAPHVRQVRERRSHGNRVTVRMVLATGGVAPEDQEQKGERRFVGPPASHQVTTYRGFTGLRLSVRSCQVPSPYTRAIRFALLVI